MQRAAVVLYSDDFQRANGDIGSSLYTDLLGDMQIVGGAARADAAGGAPAVVITNKKYDRANQWARAVVKTYNDPADQIELLFRFDGTTFNGYNVGFKDGTVYASRIDGGGPTTLDSDPFTLTAGSEIYGEMVGGTITAYVNGAAVFTATDSTYKDGSDLRIGFAILPASSTSSAELESFDGGFLDIQRGAGAVSNAPAIAYTAPGYRYRAARQWIPQEFTILVEVKRNEITPSSIASAENVVGIASFTREPYPIEIVVEDDDAYFPQYGGNLRFGGQDITSQGILVSFPAQDGETFGSMVIPSLVQIEPQSIDSLEAFGTPKMGMSIVLFEDYGGIPSGELFEFSPSVEHGLGIFPASIESAELFEGYANVSRPDTITISLDGGYGIYSEENFGSLLISRPDVLTISMDGGYGIPTEEVFGFDITISNNPPQEINLEFNMDGIESEESFSDDAVVKFTINVFADPIPSAEAFGSTELRPDQLIAVSAIPSGEAVGVPERIGVVLRPASIASLEAFGVPYIPPPQFIHVYAGIESEEFVADPHMRMNQLIEPESIGSEEIFGDVTVAGRPLLLTSIPSEEGFGLAKLLRGINVPSIPRSDEFGIARVRAGYVSEFLIDDDVEKWITKKHGAVVVYSDGEGNLHTLVDTED